jgi:hypothetical protein
MSHHCHAEGCTTPTPPKLFMCPRHWAMVPKAMQEEVWAAFRACPTREHRMRSRRYLTACADAVDHIMGAEARKIPAVNSYRRLMEAQAARHVLR